MSILILAPNCLCVRASIPHIAPVPTDRDGPLLLLRIVPLPESLDVLS